MTEISDAAGAAGAAAAAAVAAAAAAAGAVAVPPTNTWRSDAVLTIVVAADGKDAAPGAGACPAASRRAGDGSAERKKR